MLVLVGVACDRVIVAVLLEVKLAGCWCATGRCRVWVRCACWSLLCLFTLIFLEVSVKIL
jgi:hypothetical protein